MKVYGYKVKCGLCGGNGNARWSDAGKDWTGDEFFHKDPRVCAQNLKERRLELERRENALEK